MVFARGRINRAWAALPMELAAGVIFFGHGLQKVTDLGSFRFKVLPGLGVPSFMAYAVAAAEFGGGLLLLSGLLVRLSAFGHLCVMVGAISLVHWPSGLLSPGGYQFPLSLLAASLALLILGPDPLSIDQNVGFAWSSGTESVHRRRDSTDVTGFRVKAAAGVLVASGIAVPFFRGQLGVPDGHAPLAILATAGLAAAISGAALLTGKQWAYVPAFVIARLFLGASVLLLLWVKYALRGGLAVALSLIMLAALRSARRGGG